MAYIEHVTLLGVACDTRGCEAEFAARRHKNVFAARDLTRDAARKVGWTFWAGRSLRTYCPAHGPRPGHRMREVA